MIVGMLWIISTRLNNRPASYCEQRIRSIWFLWQPYLAAKRKPKQFASTSESRDNRMLDPVFILRSVVLGNNSRLISGEKSLKNLLYLSSTLLCPIPMRCQCHVIPKRRRPKENSSIPRENLQGLMQTQIENSFLSSTNLYDESRANIFYE